MIKSMSEREFLDRGVIFADTIDEAFTRYESVILSGTESQMEEFLGRALEINDEDAYADFYYPALDREAKEAFCSGLNEEEQQRLLHLETDKHQIYYPLNEENLKFFAEITAREWLFSTFYFNREKAFLWGNYGMKYPLFSDNKETLFRYAKIAVECGLEIE